MRLICQKGFLGKTVSQLITLINGHKALYYRVRKDNFRKFVEPRQLYLGFSKAVKKQVVRQVVKVKTSGKISCKTSSKTSGKTNCKTRGQRIS